MTVMPRLIPHPAVRRAGGIAAGVERNLLHAGLGLVQQLTSQRRLSTSPRS